MSVKRKALAFLLPALLLALAAPLPSPAAAPKKAPGGGPDAVIATVAGEPLTNRDLDRFIARLPENIQQAARTRKKMLLQSLVHRALMYRYAQDAELGRSARVKKELARARREILIRAAVRRVEEAAEPTDEEVRAEYTKNKARYREGEKVTAAHIMVASKKEAEDLLAKLKKGGKFDALARKYSLAPERARGGSLGTMARGAHKLTGLPEIIEKTAFSLKPGSHSGVVRSVYGWHVVRTSKREEGRQLSYGEVREKIRAGMREKKREAELNAELARLRKKYPVKSYPDRVR